MNRLVNILLLCLLTATSVAATTQVTEMHLLRKNQTAGVRLIFNLNTPVLHHVFTLSAPSRLVIDFKNTTLVTKLVSLPENDAILKSIRSGLWQMTDLRIVLDLKVAVTTKSFLLKPTGGNGHRLVVDIDAPSLKTTVTSPPSVAKTENVRPNVPPQNKSVAVNPPAIEVSPVLPKDQEKVEIGPPVKMAVSQAIPEETITTSTPLPPVKVTVNAAIPKETTEVSKVIPEESLITSAPLPQEILLPLPKGNEKGERNLIIAIDAGHGGIDPGASSTAGTKEKDVVLAIARDLAVLVTEEPGMHPVLIRNGDYFLKLRQRFELARKYKADLFISLHADAYPGDTSAQGASVYMLSRQGASSEAANWLATKENAVDLLGGISLSDKDDLLASVLLDLSQTGTLEASAHLGDEVLKAINKVGRVRYPRVQQASFIVLRAPDIPSILIETAFISNPLEEKQLTDAAARQRLAKALFTGIKAYLSKYPPSDNLLARR